jgi:hypothetical protein
MELGLETLGIPTLSVADDDLASIPVEGFADLGSLDLLFLFCFTLG